MRRFVRGVLAAGLAVVLCGCASVIGRSTSQRAPYFCMEHPYAATADVWNDCICAPWSGKTGPDAIWPTIATLTWPIWVIDLPFEVVLDTVFLPVDTAWYLAK